MVKQKVILKLEDMQTTCDLKKLGLTSSSFQKGQMWALLSQDVLKTSGGAVSLQERAEI